MTIKPHILCGDAKRALRAPRAAPLRRTTVLALVMAMAGREKILAAYRDAIRHRYRFLSYGDAMLIL
jgi:hypothetical protein